MSGWMDGVKVAFGSRGITEVVKSSGAYVDDSVSHFCFPVFFRTANACSGGLSLERGGIPLQGAIAEK